MSDIVKVIPVVNSAIFFTIHNCVFVNDALKHVLTTKIAKTINNSSIIISP